MKFKKIAITWVLCSMAIGALSSHAVAAGPAAKPKPAAGPYQIGEKLAPSKGESAASTEFKTIEWEALTPKNWDPMKDIKAMNFGLLIDGDPKATAALRRLQEAWDKAPTVPEFDKARVRIAGFVLPLDDEGTALREFLLVPYYGACIHTPPPPANQVIHVTLDHAVKGYQMMAPIWVSGTLRIQTDDTAGGVSGYAMDGVAVERFKGRM
jgi:uncharacterized protein